MAPVTKDDRVLVTGSTGYIAGWIVKLLLERGYTVRGTVRSLNKPEKRQHLVDIAEKAGAAGRLDFVEADLLKDDGWAAAVEGCAGVFHTASPFPIAVPKDEMELITPAVEGTKRVLSAAAKAGVTRVVLTSSGASVMGGHNSTDKEFTEEDWTNVESPEVEAYAKSKTLAERAAWDLVKGLPEDQSLELAVVNPTYVQGPLLSKNFASSNKLQLSLLNRENPGVPDVRISMVDVRDVAAGQIAAMETAEAAGHRHLLAKENVSMRTVGKLLATEYNPKGFKVPTMGLPYCVMWLVGRFDKEVRAALPLVGQEVKLSNKRARDVLGVEFRSIEETTLDMAKTLVDFGLTDVKPKK